MRKQPLFLCVKLSATNLILKFKIFKIVYLANLGCSILHQVQLFIAVLKLNICSGWFH